MGPQITLNFTNALSRARNLQHVTLLDHVNIKGRGHNATEILAYESEQADRQVVGRGCLSIGLGSCHSAKGRT